MATTPNVQDKTLVKSYPKRISFFNDIDIKMWATFTWKQDNKTISSIKFDLENISGKRYAFCKILECTTNPKKFVLIHLYDKGASVTDTITASDSDFGSVVFENDGDLMAFTFKVYDDSCPNDSSYNCDLSPNTPKTKDGTIIISG